MTGKRPRETRSACCYCGVGCGVIIESRDGRVSGVRGDPDHPANRGRLCTKGSTLHHTVHSADRALHPELRRQRGAPRRRATWDEALDHVAERFVQTIRRHGPDSVAFYLSGQFLTEDYYVFNKLARALVGTNNLDTNSRLCMSSAVMGYKATLGADSVPACYEDVDLAQCLFIAGSNTAVAHPIVYRRVEDARRRNPALKTVVVDPRRTETAAAADLHLQLRPGTDVALFHAMLHVMLAERLTDAAYIARHTEGFDALAALARAMSPRRAAAICGLNAGDIVQAARWFAAPGGTVSLYCQGLNQSVAGTDKNAALIALHLATGQIGKPGAGPLSLTGQPNAMGGREAGGMATLLAGHRDLANPQHRDEMARFWGVEAIPAHPGKTAVELFDALARGEVKAVWVACTNPAQSLPDQRRVRAALAHAELVVVQEAYRSAETVAFADVLLPAAAWGEKDGTMTNSERRITRMRAAVAPPGEARADWEIGADFARRLAPLLGRGDGVRLFPYSSAEQVFDEHRETTRGRDLDIAGLSYALLDAHGPQQWPFPEGAAAGAPRLYTDGWFATPSGRARFPAAPYRPVAEAVDAAFDLALTTGRLRDQWHGMSRSGTVARLYAHTPEPALAMHPADLARRGLADGDLVAVTSRRGALTLPVEASRDVAEGQAFVPMHWGGRFLAGGGVNVLTLPAVDPASKQPELKHAAVAVTRALLPWRLAALRMGDAPARLARVSALLDRFGYASCGLVGREQTGVVLRAAAAQPFDAALLAEVDAALALDRPGALALDDAAAGVHKRVLVTDDRLVGFRLAGETCAAAWLTELATGAAPVGSLRRLLLAPLANPPALAPARGRIVCNCLDVAESDITTAVAAGAGLEQLQERLRCGTECGSCVPELRRLLAAARVAA
ncbi:MAG: molybdopterin-dependent oxidoreductase [Pseudomonadota bacterium]